MINGNSELVNSAEAREMLKHYFDDEEIDPVWTGHGWSHYTAGKKHTEIQSAQE